MVVDVDIGDDSTDSDLALVVGVARLTVMVDEGADVDGLTLLYVVRVVGRADEAVAVAADAMDRDERERVGGM